MGDVDVCCGSICSIELINLDNYAVEFSCPESAFHAICIVLQYDVTE